MGYLKNGRPDSRELWWSLVFHYGCAVVSVALAIWVRILLDPLLGDHSRYALLLLAILLTAWYGGGRPGLTALILGVFSADYFLITPRGGFGHKGTEGFFELILYACVGLGIVLICGFMRSSSLRSVQALEQTQKDLAQSEDRLGLVLQSSGICVWSWDIKTNVMKADEQYSVIFGVPLGQFPHTPAEFAEALHPDDRERVQQAIAATLESGVEYKIEFRTVWPNGTVRALASRGKMNYGEDGQPVQMTGLCWDVTEHHQAQENQRIANEKLSQSVKELELGEERAATLSKMNGLLQACSGSKEAYEIVSHFCGHLFPMYAGAIYMFSASRNLVNRVATWNDPIAGEIEFEPDDCWALRRGQPHITNPGLIGTPCRHLKDIPGGHACLPLMAQGTGLGILYLEMQSGAGAPEQFLPAKDLQLASSVAENIAISLSNLYLQEALRRQSLRDPLTGLFNRRYLEESVERELHRLARRELPAGFAMLDLDHFKTFNDTFGHEGGDALLCAFGQFLKEHLRKEDIACRYGGEEFCILFCESSLEETLRRAEQLRLGVSKLIVRHRGQHLGVVTVSIGVACYPTHGSTLNDLVAAADGALYRAKADGRNCVIAATASSTRKKLPDETALPSSEPTNFHSANS
jgi:diguanylate cyclase (GGDEF)-like protein/PAS domain S-box-containing protein